MLVVAILGSGADGAFGDTTAQTRVTPLPVNIGTAERAKGAAPLSSGVSLPQRALALPPLAAPAIQEANRHNAHSGQTRFQIGVGRTFDQPIIMNRGTLAAEEWTTLSNGWKTAAVEVSSADALGLRIHLESVTLPEGARLVVYDPANPAPDPSPVTAQSLAGKREVWTSTLFSDRAVVEAQVPPGTDPKKVAFTVTGVSHLFILPTASGTTKEGACEVDVTCYPDYALEASGVARIAFVSAGNAYLCSGCLLASSDPASTADYFLTANHCVGDQDTASTLELFWFFQTSTCNGTPPAISSVPTTGGGADLLATSSYSDFCFLRLRQVPPSGTYHLPWSTNMPSPSETLVGIHHPTGSYKRISFGHLATEDAQFWAVQWYLGVTEDGSSGSPLLNGAHEVIGQLYGGFEGGAGSSCSSPTTVDAYGRFDDTFPSVQQWLGTNAPAGQFSPVQGTYTGLFFDATNGIALQSAGSFSLTSTSKGRFSGRLQLGAAKYSFSGMFDSNGSAQINAGRGKQSSLAVQLQVDATNSDHLTGTVNGGTWTAQLDGNRAVFSSKNLSPQAGQYTLIIPGAGGGTNGAGPGGDSYGVATVSKAGSIHLSGSLADGTSLSQAATVSADGRWPLSLSLYGGQGLLLGWLNFTNSGTAGLSGTVAWIKPVQTKARYYSGGFNTLPAVVGSPYSRPPRGGTVLDFTDANLVVNGADLSQAITNQVALQSNNRVVDMSGNSVTMSFTTSSGLFGGTMINPTTAKKFSFRGVALQNQNSASGYFLSAGSSGEVLVSP